MVMLQSAINLLIINKKSLVPSFQCMCLNYYLLTIIAQELVFQATQTEGGFVYICRFYATY